MDFLLKAGLLLAWLNAAAHAALELGQTTLTITSASSANAIVIYDSSNTAIFSLLDNGNVVMSNGVTISSGGGLKVDASLSIQGATGLAVQGNGLKSVNGLTVTNTRLNANGGLEVTGGVTVAGGSSTFSVTGGLSMYGTSSMAVTTLSLAPGGTFVFLTRTYIKENSACNGGESFLCFNKASDMRFKRDISSIPTNEALRQIMATRPVSYMWREDAPLGLGADRRTQVGFIAQELEEALDHEGASVVHRTQSPSGGEILTVDYGRLTALLAGAVQAQEEEINKIRSRLGFPT